MSDPARHATDFDALIRELGLDIAEERQAPLRHAFEQIREFGALIRSSSILLTPPPQQP